MIYLDNNATTGLDPEVFAAMYGPLQGVPCNPSSLHFYGRQAKEALTEARKSIADYLKVSPETIVFTSGGTEGINMAIRGMLGPKPSGHIVSSNLEHSSVYETIRAMVDMGCTADFTFSNIPDHTKLIALSWVNSETGEKRDIAAIGETAKKREIPLVIDAIALMGKEEISIPDGVSAAVFSAHKFHGPKGVGFVYIEKGQKWEPYLTGGGQEYARRSGTENLEGIIGCAKAVELLQKYLPQKSYEMKQLRDHLETSLIRQLQGVAINGKEPRVVNTCNLYFEGVDGEELLYHLDKKKVAASHGSACASGSIEPSRVLIHMGLGRKRARSSVRFSLSRRTTKEEIDQAICILTDLVTKLRKM